jgi:hypothetical protein
MDIMLEKWPFKAQEYLKYMQCIRLAASRGYNNGWIAYDEQYRLRKTRLPFSSSCYFVPDSDYCRGLYYMELSF